MQVRREECWSGGDDYHFRLIVVSPKSRYNERFVVSSDSGKWDRKTATSALNTLQLNTGVNRNSIKWV